MSEKLSDCRQSCDTLLLNEIFKLYGIMPMLWSSIEYISFDCYGTLTNFQIGKLTTKLFADRVPENLISEFLIDYSAFRFDEVLWARFLKKVVLRISNSYLKRTSPANCNLTRFLNSGLLIWRTFVKSFVIWLRKILLVFVWEQSVAAAVII